MSGILTIDNLAIDYRLAAGWTPAVRGIDLEVRPGQVLGLIGESGSGKSTVALSILRLLASNARVASGSISLDSIDVLSLPERRMNAMRGTVVGLVPQDPGVSLNPVKKIGAQVAEVLLTHGIVERSAVPARVVDLLARVGLNSPERIAKQFPFQLSGGMRQRVLIAIAIAASPRLIIADEPTSALDVTAQRTILELLDTFVREEGMSMLLVTHDIAVAAERADTLAVMRDGLIVETGPTDIVINTPTERYTRELVRAVPVLDVSSPPRPESPVLLSVTGLTREFSAPGQGLRREVTLAVDDVSFELRRGETLGLVGESGSGKTSIARLVLRLAEPTRGGIRFDGIDVLSLRGQGLRDFRGRAQLVYQNPYASLDPRFTVEQIISEGLGGRADVSARVARLLDQVALPRDFAERRPAQLSGGQRQRVAIARALAVEPELLVLDEAVSALDVSVQAQILDLLRDLQQQLGLTYLFISHDLAVVRQLAHTVGVMRNGKLIEWGLSDQVFESPRHDYTTRLLGAVPTIIRHNPADATITLDERPEPS